MLQSGCGPIPPSYCCGPAAPRAVDFLAGLSAALFLALAAMARSANLPQGTAPFRDPCQPSLEVAGLRPSRRARCSVPIGELGCSRRRAPANDQRHECDRPAVQRCASGIPPVIGRSGYLLSTVEACCREHVQQQKLDFIHLQITNATCSRSTCWRA